MFNNINLNVQAGKRSMAKFRKVNKSRHGIHGYWAVIGSPVSLGFDSATPDLYPPE